MINEAKAIESRLDQTFGTIDRTTLSKIKGNRTRFELGGSYEFIDRVNHAINKAQEVLNYCFEGKGIWLRIILWDTDAEISMLKAGLKKSAFHTYYKEKFENEDVLYLQLVKYESILIEPLIKSVVNYELGEDPSANITCYYINFENQIIANLYDDRGMDVVSLDKLAFKKLRTAFSDWIVK